MAGINSGRLDGDEPFRDLERALAGRLCIAGGLPSEK